MKTQKHRLVIALLLGFGFINPGFYHAYAQEKLYSRTSAVPDRKKRSVMSREEKLVRDTYEKLTVYHRAGRLYKADGSGKTIDDDSVLKFELKDFRVGPIQEIAGTLHRDLVTLPTGDIIQIHPSTYQNTQYFHGGIKEVGEEQASYGASWTSGQYASVYDRQWTIGDLLGFEPATFYDIGAYASYEVTVSFEGKTRTYRALALFHNPYQSLEALKPSFWDSVVGMGASLTDVWKQKLPTLNILSNVSVVLQARKERHRTHRILIRH